MKVLFWITTITILIQINTFAQIQAMPEDSLQQKLEEIAEQYHIPGATIAFFSSDSILNIGKTGVRQLGQSSAVQIDDKFHLGSNTKAMTAFAAAVLVEKGLIKWDSRFFDLFPELRAESRPEYLQITLEDLFRHRAFIRPFTDGDEFDAIPQVVKGNVIQTRLDWTRDLLKMEPVSIDSNLSFTYSNAGYAIACTMLEKVTGKEYETIIQDYVFTPLNINGGFGWPNEKDDNQPWGHATEEGDSTISTMGPKHEYKLGKIISPAGDIHMSILDYIKYLQTNMKGFRGVDNLLSKETYQYLIEVNEEYQRYAMGWGVGKVKLAGKRNTFVTHSGSGGTYYCQTCIIPELNIGLCIMMNAGDEEHEEAARALRNFLLRYVNAQ